MKNLIDFVSKEMKRRDWTLTELARRCELAPATLSDVLNGKARPGLRFYIGVSRALQCSVDHLLRLAEELPASVGRVDELSEEEARVVELWRELSPLKRPVMLEIWEDQVRRQREDPL